MTRQQLYPPEVLAHDSAKVAALLGDAWSIRIISSLSRERQRFSQLQHGLHMSSKTLSSRLKSLEKQAIISRTLYAQVPLRVEYELTAKGYELKGLLEEFVTWDKKWQ